jgi:hypothetical protein
VESTFGTNHQRSVGPQGRFWKDTQERAHDQLVLSRIPCADPLQDDPVICEGIPSEARVLN